MPFKNIGTNLSINACGSRCIARCSTSTVICRSGASKVCGKRSIRYWDVAKSALYLPLPAGSQPGAIQSQSDVQPCFKRRLFHCRVFPLRLLYFCWCSGLYGRVLPVSGAPAHMTCFLWQNPFNRFTDFDVFFRLGSA